MNSIRHRLDEAEIATLPAIEHVHSRVACIEENEELAGKVQKKLHDKGTELRDRLQEAAETFRENLTEGVQSAVKRGSQAEKRFGRPPSGQPPVGRQPLVHNRMS